MICVSLAEKTTADVTAALRSHSFAEVRLDAIEDLTDAGIKAIFSGPGRLIATHRPGRIPEPARIDRLRTAVEAGAAFVDIEVETADDAVRKVEAAAHRRGCRVIVSYHNERETPARGVLEDIRSKGYAAGADLVKIACHSSGHADNARLLGLLDFPRPVIVIGMGPLGRITRLAAPLLGAPFTYASAGKGKGTASGQLDAAIIRRFWEVWKND